MDLKTLDERLKTILPEEYQECYEDVQPVSMGSAGLKYDADGKVAWNEMWGSFCDLALAGGPPHKGTLLEPIAPEEGHAVQYEKVVAEICRGIKLVTDLWAEPSPIPGWVRVDCDRKVTAGWLARAITIENVSVYAEDTVVDLPAGANYRLEKEIKNVITVIAKTSHYFEGHLWSGQQRKIAELFAKTEAESPLVQPASPGHGFDQERHDPLSSWLVEAIGMKRSGREYPGWLGIECVSVSTAVWMMRSLVACNILSRREETVLYLPVNPRTDPTGEIVVRAFKEISGLASNRAVNS